MATASPEQVSPPTSLVHPPKRPPAVPPSMPQGHLQPPSPTAVENNSQAASHPSFAVEDNNGAATSRTRDHFKRSSEANKKNREAGLSTVYKGGSAPMGRYKKRLSKDGYSLTIFGCLVLVKNLSQGRRTICFKKSYKI
ncbi:hypothetical protein CCACVL1_10919 [Corchorus capsularis]|uniref:Uncharacterized protein n=1 Tax=Corchorus capsularis TaxID=210143 RepID=A0A1R3INV9_COCAP|nr:hypothetical protein CCACVL1_10919 [Corchorus capsularis]